MKKQVQSLITVNEIFYSIQGESSRMGLPTVFIRLTGCPLRCSYCDTEYAFKGGERLSIPQILTAVAAYQPTYITVTGGEPLAQKNCLSLLTALCDENYQISLETSGALEIQEVDVRVKIVMDLKTPSSHEVDKNLWENLKFLKPTDEIKYVISDQIDYEWAKSTIHTHQLTQRVSNLLFSPCFDQLPAQQLAEWILADRLPVRMQLQLHKFIWTESRGR